MTDGTFSLTDYSATPEFAFLAIPPAISMIFSSDLLGHSDYFSHVVTEHEVVPLPSERCRLDSWLCRA